MFVVFSLCSEESIVILWIYDVLRPTLDIQHMHGEKTLHIEEWGSIIELKHIIISSKMWNIKTTSAMYFPAKLC